jgi:hypothetical protein
VQGDLDQSPLEVDIVLDDGTSILSTLLQCGVLERQNDMEEYYQRSQDIADILKVWRSVVWACCVFYLSLSAFIQVIANILTGTA